MCSKQRYSQQEIDAAYALLALSNSTQAASPPGYKTAVNKPGAKLQSAKSAKCSRDNQFSLLSQAASEQRHLQTPQIPELIPASQVSPLVELNTFVAATLPVRDESYVFNPAYHVSQPVSFFSVDKALHLLPQSKAQFLKAGEILKNNSHRRHKTTQTPERNLENYPDHDYRDCRFQKLRFQNVFRPH